MSNSKATNKQSINNPVPVFPVAKQARKLCKQALVGTKNPVETISNFQQEHSLHSYLSKAFGTTSVYELRNKRNNRTNKKGGRDGGSSVGGGGSILSSGGKRVTRGDVELKTTREREGITVEPFETESVLTFLNHLGVSRYEIHKKVGDALRMKLESEIEKVDLKSNGSGSGSGAGGKEKLLKLLKSSWEYTHIPALRPVLISLVKKLGDQTPVDLLLMLAKKDTGNTNSKQKQQLLSKADDPNANANANLIYGELLNQFGLPMKRLVWEADWTSKVRGDGTPVVDPPSDSTGTLQSTDILADVVRTLVEEYTVDEYLTKNADLAFTASIRDRKLDTHKRRGVSSSSTDNTIASSTLITGTLSSLTSKGTGGQSKSADTNHSAPAESTVSKSSTELNHKPSAGISLAKLKQIMGMRPKLLAALFNMLLSEHGRHFNVKDTNNNSSLNNDSSTSKRVSILGGESYLHCSLVADILLSYGQLPKPYEHVHILAQILDDSVRKGLISDQAIAQIQGCLRAIFQPEGVDKDGEKDKDKSTAASSPSKPASASASTPNTGTGTDNPKKSKPSLKLNSSSAGENAESERQVEIRLIRKIVRKAVAQLKDNDMQRLFLNPVTEEIAPGYSKVIDKPICLAEIEEKATNLSYSNLSQFEKDVQLMYENCIKYNIGQPGQWFRGEARRQLKKWNDTVLKSSKDIYRLEMNKRGRKKAVVPTPSVAVVDTKMEEAQRIRAQQQSLMKKLAGSKNIGGEKRKHASIVGEKNDDSITSLMSEDINPLSQSRNKKSKKDTDFPSMPALASMLLSDPFVVRLLLDRVQRAMRGDIIKDQGIPSIHKTTPSILQLLYIVQISTQLCAKRGKVYTVPDVGFHAITSSEDSSTELTDTEPFIALRKYTPLVIKLILETEIDKRLSIGGDLYSYSIPTRPETRAEDWAGSSSLSGVLICLVQGALVYLLQPGVSNEMALLVQLPRFFTALKELSGGNMIHEKSFYVSLSQTILKHKFKLPHSVRDLIVHNWLDWFQASDGASSMTTAVHVCFIQLLNEWYTFGNQILPQLYYLSFAKDAVSASEKNERDESMTFSHYWKNDLLGDVKVQYERMLKHVPKDRCLKWRQSVGLDTSEEIYDIEMEIK